MEQLSIFDLLAQDKPLPNKIRLLSLFSGIGAFEKALDRIGVAYDLVNYCEIDKYASRSYAAIHNVSEDLNLWDVTKVDEKVLPKDVDLLTYGFPCVDISLAGKQKGLFNDDGTKTRSGLYFDALRIIEETQPKVAIAENVKNLLGKKFTNQFQIVLDSLESAGYNNYYQVLNSKDFGIPQNRERVFIVSIRKDIDKGFTFPKGFPLEKRLKDVLEGTVDEKYYLSDKMIRYLEGLKAECAVNGNGFGYQPTTGEGVAKTIQANAQIRSTDTLIQCGQIYPNSGNPQQAVVEPKVIGGIGEKKSNGGKQWYQQDRVYDDGVAISVTTGFNPYYATQEPMAYDEQNQYVRNDGCVGTLTTDGSSPKHNNRVLVWDGFNQRIRADQSCVGTLTQNCGADLKRNGQGIIEVGTRKDIKQLEKYCEYCGAKLERKRFNGRLEDFNVFSNRKYCNRECMKRGYLKIGKGDQGWTTAHHTARKINELILKKDCCEICGGKKNLDIHHIDGDWQNNNLDNLMCLCRSCHTKHERNKDKTPQLRIRKLTPLETWRLMGFDDSDFHKAELVNSNSQLYKQAGNSIVVDVLEHLLKQVFKAI